MERSRLRLAIRRSWKERQLQQAGFTLVELLVVLVILALIASLVGPRVIGYLGSSRTKAATLQIESIHTSLELFHVDVGRYPKQNEGLEALIQNPAGLETWNGPYLARSKLPLDPWGHPYRYKVPGKSGPFDVFTYGRDDKEGGTGEDADVSS